MTARKILVLGYLLILVSSLAIASGIWLKSLQDEESARRNYREVSQRELEAAASQLTTRLLWMYQGLRTISLLPGVQSIDRYGLSLGRDARASIEQIYENMAANLAVSEIYIVPVDLQPERVDPQTRNLQTPILMYDGKPLPEGNAPDSESPAVTTVAQALAQEEVEIYEYRQLQEHMAFLGQFYGNRSQVQGLNFPLLSGPPVLTCDNQEFLKTRQDQDRSGLLFTVPFYSPQGQLRGGITAIVREEVLARMLPPTDFALLNEENRFQLGSAQGGEVLGKAHDLLFSDLVSLPLPDPRSHWKLWAGFPNRRFEQRADVQSTRAFLRIAGVLTGLGALLAAASLTAVVWVRQQREREIQEAAQERRRGLQEMADAFEATIKQVVSQVAGSALSMESIAEAMSRAADETRNRSLRVASTSHEVSDISMQVAASAEELTSSIRDINLQTVQSQTLAEKARTSALEAQSVIGEVVRASGRVTSMVGEIQSVISKINLLALNAHIGSTRAGSSGREFAVVAGEVKKLAEQVGTATRHIEGSLAAMQEATGKSVHSIAAILDITHRVSENTQAVATAIQQQTAATDEIARHIAGSSRASQEISRSIGLVQQGAEEAGNTSQEVLHSSRRLNHQSNLLKSKVEEFLGSICA